MTAIKIAISLLRWITGLSAVAGIVATLFSTATSSQYHPKPITLFAAITASAISGWLLTIIADAVTDAAESLQQIAADLRDRP